MSKSIEYASYKKLLIFGTKCSGKTTLAKTFGTEEFNDEDIKPSENSRNILYIIYILLNLFKYRY